MSIAARQSLVTSGKLVFQHASQKSDLLDPALTVTELIAAMLYLTSSRGWHIEVTAVRTDHHDDGPNWHAGGKAFDGWPLASSTPQDYLDASDPRFQHYLVDCADVPYLYQIGLAGTADTAENRGCAGPTVFEDSGGDHVHLGVT